MTHARKGVLAFLNEGKTNELVCVKGLTVKKIEVMTELRPFTDWSDLRAKLQSGKGLTWDLLNFSQDYLHQRNNMVRIMQKCSKLVKQLEIAVARGGGSVTQPAILNPE